MTEATLKAFAKSFAAICILLLALFAMTRIFQRSNQPFAAATGARALEVTAYEDDAAVLLGRCGPPDADETTAYDDPRPPVPSRVLVYRKHNVRAAYVPGYGATIADRPPYHWKLAGFTDARSRAAISATEASRRLGCR